MVATDGIEDYRAIFDQFIQDYISRGLQGEHIIGTGTNFTLLEDGSVAVRFNYDFYNWSKDKEGEKHWKSSGYLVNTWASEKKDSLNIEDWSIKNYIAVLANGNF